MSLLPRLMRKRAIPRRASTRAVSYSFTVTLSLWNTLTRVAILPIFLPLLANLGITYKTICTRSNVALRGWEWTTASAIFQAQG